MGETQIGYDSNFAINGCIWPNYSHRIVSSENVLIPMFLIMFGKLTYYQAIEKIQLDDYENYDTIVGTKCRDLIFI